MTITELAFIAVVSAAAIGFAALIYIGRDPFDPRFRYWTDVAVLPSVLLAVATVWAGVFGLVPVWVALAAPFAEFVFLAVLLVARLLTGVAGPGVTA